MSDIVEAVRKVLLDAGAVSAVFSTRIYPMGKPLGATLPEAHYKRVSEVMEFETDVKAVRLQITVIDDSYTDALTAAKVIRTALHKYSGVKLGVTIVQIAFMSQTDDLDQDASGVVKMYWVNTDYQVVFR